MSDRETVAVNGREVVPVRNPIGQVVCMIRSYDGAPDADCPLLSNCEGRKQMAGVDVTDMQFERACPIYAALKAEGR